MKSLLPTIESSANALSKLSLSLHHSLAIKLGTLSDAYTANIILNEYAKFGESSLVQRLFDEIPNRDTCSWNTIISGYINHGNFQNAFKILKDMKRAGLYGDGYTFGSILKGVACFEEIKVGQQVHSLILKTGFAGNVYSGSALLDMYAKCRRVEDARVVFGFIPEPNKVSWNALISGCAQSGNFKTAFGVLDAMEHDGLSVDDGTFAPLLTLVNKPEMYKLAIQIHGKIVKHGLQCNNIVCNALITSYSSCGSLEDAQKVFDSAFGTRDLVTWNSMLAAYLEHDKGGLAVELFLEMQRLGSQPDIYTYTSIISGCSEDALLNHGKSLHGLVIKRGLEQSIPISNSLMAMYLKSNNKSMEDALSIFDSMESKDHVSWNSVLTGFSHMGMSEDALNFFLRMRSMQLEIDQFAFSAVLKSCSDLAILQLGQQVHASVVKVGFELNEFVASSLIFMYSRCGILDDARKSFEATTQDTSITWNSIIFGYAQHGKEVKTMIPVQVPSMLALLREGFSLLNSSGFHHPGEVALASDIVQYVPMSHLPAEITFTIVDLSNGSGIL
ncbi:Pentatricopeptide repeat [Dillenia turbinata]|uniref:Pentatricopeptide repeat n=1 Tax=Dillenia turbinata TaxID=194707 RepID=A0AAN8V9X1_9MAGN